MTSNIIVLKFVMKFLGFGYERMEHKTQITCCTATSLWGGRGGHVPWYCIITTVVFSRGEGLILTLTPEQTLLGMGFSRLQRMTTQVQTGIFQGSLFISKNLVCQFAK